MVLSNRIAEDGPLFAELHAHLNIFLASSKVARPITLYSAARV